ncbi:hypothetical protein EGI32_15300 [Ferruginibacter sp. HRS2-29]|nr:hypothetical protein [Ferruginibacter sp. HRS2-29]
MIFSFSNSFSQKIEGTYRYEPVSKKGAFEIEIKNDSTYILKSNTDPKIYQGKVTRKSRKFYALIQYDSVAKSYVENIVKITRTRMFYYGYKQIGPGEFSKKPIKALELKKVEFY